MSRTIAIALGLMAAMLGASAQAQDGVAAWRVECTGDGKMLDCRAVQQLFQRIPNQGDRLLIAVLVRRPPDAKAAQMAIQAAPSTHAQPGFTRKSFQTDVPVLTGATPACG